MKKKLEIRPIIIGSMVQKAIFIDGEHFDWSVDEESLKEAAAMGEIYFQAVQKDIAKHFLDSLSEVVGREVTLAEFNQALITGEI